MFKKKVERCESINLLQVINLWGNVHFKRNKSELQTRSAAVATVTFVGSVNTLFPMD